MKTHVGSHGANKDMQQKVIADTSATELEQPDLYLNREQSWIEFNRRVFQEAQNTHHPLLERVKFLSIFDSNLDEYIMIRLAGLKDQLAAHVISLSPDGLTAEEQLAAVRVTLAPLIQEVHYCWINDLIPLLAEKHIHILNYEQLNEVQRAAMLSYFEREI